MEEVIKKNQNLLKGSQFKMVSSNYNSNIELEGNPKKHVNPYAFSLCFELIENYREV